jgi:hypothetical protein
VLTARALTTRAFGYRLGMLRQLSQALDRIIGTMDKYPDYPMEFLSRTGRKLVEQLAQEQPDEADDAGAKSTGKRRSGT